MRGLGPSVTPHRTASASTRSRPRPDSASGDTGRADGIRSPHVSVTSIRSGPRITLSPTAWTAFTAYAASAAQRKMPV
ncbi:hypothetical protein [Streptomyces spectabilis]|uniref:DUF397 domain-containing protein n=1 Tax=Streptomyces spectabilis TaxID=68270 RepID=A0A7W8ATR6_STRST|nr:hypothetical protein [Streptomyces spectabilis]